MINIYPHAWGVSLLPIRYAGSGHGFAFSEGTSMVSIEVTKQ